MIMTVILNTRKQPVLSLTHNTMTDAENEAKRINEANNRLGLNYHAVVEVIH